MPDAPAPPLVPPEEALGRARAWLARVRNADGTWGYLPGARGRPEPTLLALAADPTAPVPWEWLGTADLGFAARLLPLVLTGIPGAEDLCTRHLDAIEAEQGLVADAMGTFDTTIPGWGWVPGTAPWLVPTCHAVLSLRRGGRATSPRVLDGTRLVLDRQGRDGGWNYGNPDILGKALESQPDTTAWALLVLQGEPEPASRDITAAVARGLAFLDGCASLPSALARASVVLARVSHGRVAGSALPDLVRLQSDDGPLAGSFHARIDTTAMAAAALALALEAPHPFHLSR